MANTYKRVENISSNSKHYDLNYPEIEAELLQLHPYDTPEIILAPTEEVSHDYYQ